MRRTPPINWAKLTNQICEDRAGGRCECAGQCGDAHVPVTRGAGGWRNHSAAKAQPVGQRCAARVGHTTDDGEWVRLHPEPLDGVLWHTTPENLLAMCQPCRARYNAKGLEQPPAEAPEGLFDMPETGGGRTPTL